MRKAHIYLLFMLLFFLSGCRSADKSIEMEEESIQWAMIPCVMVDGETYVTTGYHSSLTDRPAGYDGIIDSEVPGTQLPTKNNQSNFGAGYYYQYGSVDGTVEIFMDGQWWIYATDEVKQSDAYMEAASVDAHKAYQNIFSYYGVEHMHLDYQNFPENFGGCYMDDDLLHILLVAPTEESQSQWESVCGTSDFIIDEVTYSYRDLYAANEALEHYNRSTPDNSPMYDTFWNLDMMNNRISAVITQEMEQDILSLQQAHPCIVYTVSP